MSNQDGMTTSDWNDLVATYCPQVFLCTINDSQDGHHVEPYWPSTIGYYLVNTFLICQEERFVHVTDALLGQCPDTGGFLSAQASSFGGQHQAMAPATEGSSTQVLTAPIHVHIRNAAGGAVEAGELDLQYWFFYPYNGTVDIDLFGHYINTGLGAHQGDWEHVTVRLAAGWRSTPTIKAVYYAAHANEGSWQTAPPMNGDTHPVAYSAWDSHASYPTTGVLHRHIKYDLGVLVDFTSQGQQWGPSYYDAASKSQVSVAQIASIDSDVYVPGDENIADAPWIPFQGRWGATSDSPPNPPVQGYWQADPSP